MANSESIRFMTIGREAVAGVLAATTKALPFQSLTHSPKKAILQPDEFRGVRLMKQVSLAGVQHSEIKVKTFGYYDLLGWILAAAFNAPTDAANDTTAFDHTFKTGAGSVPSNSLQWSYGIGTAVAVWEQALGAYVQQIDFTYAADKLVEIDVTWLSNFATQPSPVTPPAFSVASYLHPFGQSGMQSVKIAGASGYPAASLISGKVSLKNGRTPLHTIQASADPARFIEGPITVDFDFEADYTALTASFYKNYLDNATPGIIDFINQDTVNTIGSTNAAKPTFKLTIPKPYFTSAELKPNNQGNTTVSAKGQAIYDTGTSSGLTALLTNMIASYPGT